MRRVGEETRIPSVLMKDASYPAPFDSGLEYSVPARGAWTIVHVGMLVPEAHEIFVCAAGCLRGVVLSAAEMNLAGRFSTVAIEEQNVLDGDMEELLIEGVSDILNRLPGLPRVVLIYSSCIHHFMGCDLAMCYRELGERFPAVDFVDCYMIPTMRKSGFTPDQIMRRQLYSLLKPGTREKDGWLPELGIDEKHCAIVGNCFSLDENSDLMRLLKSAGFIVHQITDCKTYEEYLEMGRCSICISTQPVAKLAGEALEQRLGMKHLYLPVCYGPEEIRQTLTTLAHAMGIHYDGGQQEQREADAAMRRVKKIAGDIPIAVDYTFTPRPLGLVRLLIRYGFRMEKLFVDSISGEEREDYLWLQENAPEILIYPTVHPGMRCYPLGNADKILALGQKAAYFTDSPYFVNLVGNGGLYGFWGIKELARLMEEALAKPKDIEKTIQIKGLGCESCL